MKDAFIVAETHAVHINPSGINLHTGHTNTPESTVNSGHKKGFTAKKIKTAHMQPYTHAHVHNVLLGIAALSPWQSAQEFKLRVIHSILVRLNALPRFPFKKNKLLISTVDFFFFFFFFFSV